MLLIAGQTSWLSLHSCHRTTAPTLHPPTRQVTLSVIEIYCERIKDLLDPSRDNLQVGAGWVSVGLPAVLQWGLSAARVAGPAQLRAILALPARLSAKQELVRTVDPSPSLPPHNPALLIQLCR